MNARPDARDFAGPQKFGIGQPRRAGHGSRCGRDLRYIRGEPESPAMTEDAALAAL
jgi:hypothetical protein